MNIIVSIKDVHDLSIVFMQKAFQIWRHYLLMLRTYETFCQALVQSADQISNK